MKSIILFTLSIFILSQSFTDPVVQIDNIKTDETVTWLSWDEAVELNKTNPKKIFIDVYTDWCGWCKKMDKSTFLDAYVTKELNDNFHAIKFNAEQKDDIEFDGTKFKFVASGRRGYHELAMALLNGRMGYPSFVVLDENFARIMISPGYKTAEQLIPELEFATKEHYKQMSWENYQNMLGR